MSELTYGHKKAAGMFPSERFYGSMWDEAREKVAAELDKTIWLDLKKQITLNRVAGQLTGALKILPHCDKDKLAALIRESVQLIDEVLK